MREIAIVSAILAAAIALIVTSFWLGGPRDFLPYMLAYFAFFSLGPVVNFVFGAGIYHGTNVRLIEVASLGLLLALLGMFLVGITIRVPVGPFNVLADQKSREFHLVPVIHTLLGAYATITILMRGPALVAGDKLSRISAAGEFHSTFLTIQLCAFSMYFIAMKSRAGRISFTYNAIAYLSYCFLTQERDFLFVIFSILLHVQLFRLRAMGGRIALAGILSAVAATILLNLRSGDGFGTAEILNQGSVLFVDTFVLEYVPAAVPYSHGASYLAALGSLLPNNILSDPDSLTNWLAHTYAPGASGGYGFSLTAEAYMNFGTAGIPVIFALLATIQRLLVLRVPRGPFWGYASMVYTIVWMYTIRGESVVIVRMLFYGVVFYIVVHIFSTFTWRSNELSKFRNHSNSHG